MKNLFLLALVLALAVGCASTGTYTSADLVNQKNAAAFTRMYNAYQAQTKADAEVFIAQNEIYNAMTPKEWAAVPEDTKAAFRQKREVLEAKREVLVELEPLIRMYSLTVDTGQTPTEELAAKIIELITRLED